MLSVGEVTSHVTSEVSSSLSLYFALLCVLYLPLAGFRSSQCNSNSCEGYLLMLRLIFRLPVDISNIRDMLVLCLKIEDQRVC